MNWLHQMKGPWVLLALSSGLLLVAGCSTTETGSGAARPGDGIREYRRLATDLRKVVTGCVESVEALAKAPEAKATAGHARFDESVHRLEVASIKARARVEAMEKRGEAYFEEWSEEITRSGAADQERFIELRRQFELILSDTRQVRQEFRQFIDGLRGARSKLGPSPTAATITNVKPVLSEIATEGHQVEVALHRLVQTLNVAETAVVSEAKQRASNGGKP